MAERYLNMLSFRLQGYDGRPLPENLTAAMSLAVDVGAKVDLDRLVDEIREDLGPRSRSIHQAYRETSWGASGSGADIAVSISAVAGGAGGLATVWDVISRRVRSRGRVRTDASATPTESARHMVAQCLNIGADDIRVVSLEPVGDGHRVGLETRLGSWTIEIDRQGVSRLHRS